MNIIMKAYRFEIYTNNAITGESGWDIVFRTVFADDIETARANVSNTPLFDCIILHSHTSDIDMSDLTSSQYEAIEVGYTDEDIF